jgi:glycosyltransferase involved in cell wall biosynthesis
MPPSRSGIAAYSSEILPLLRTRHELVDVFVDRSPAKRETGVWSAHDYVWKRRRNAYDLTVFQLGNAACHDYMWAYLFRYPGLVVLHDAQLHQARALSLTRGQHRRDDYREEFHANHPAAPADLGDLFLAGLGEGLYQHWPHIRLVVERARMTVVHNARVRDDLAERYPGALFDAIEMGVKGCEVRGARGEVQGATSDVRAKHGLTDDAIVVAAFGGLTPEKRIGPLIRAVRAVSHRHPNIHLLLVGAEHKHFDVRAAAQQARIDDRVHITGYVADEDLPAYLAATDICACLRWPTNRETSASWLRCLAAGRPTLITELTHLVDVPALDPHSWRPRRGSGDDAIAVSIDVLDEANSLRVALDRLADDPESRAVLGKAAHDWWSRHHRLESMADHYDRVMSRAATLPEPHPTLPRHLTANGSAKAHTLAETTDVAAIVADLFN